MMLERWLTAAAMRDVLKSGDTDIGEVPDSELLKYVPPIVCKDTDIWETYDDMGALFYVTEFNDELIILNMEDDN